MKLRISQKGFIKLTKNTLISYLIISIVFFSSGFIYLFNPWTVKETQAVWFNDNWYYRQRIPIDTHTASETNVYNEITVDTATLTTEKLQADCDDLRFTKQNGEILPYNIVSGCDSATTTIRVGFDTMPIAPFNIYMYFGNPTAASGSTTLTHAACGNGCAEGTFAAEEKGPNPTLYWQFEQGQGSTAEDSTTNALDGTTGAALTGLAFGAHTNTTFNTTSSKTFSHTTSGYDRVLTVIVPFWQSGAGTVSGITYNGVALTLVGRSARSAGDDRVEIWQLIAPALGTNDVVISWSGVVEHAGGASATSFTGAHQTTPTGTFASATGTTTTATVTVTSASDEIVVDGVALDAVGATLTMATQTGRTERQNSSACCTELFGHSTQTSPGTSEVMDWTLGASKDWAMAGVSVKPPVLTAVSWKTEDFCVSGKCLQFTGSSNNNVNKSDDAKLDFVAADNFTLSAWVKRNGAASAASYIMTKAQSGYTGYKTYMDASGDFCFDVRDGTNTDSACTSGVDFDDDKWHFVEAVKAGTTSITLYVDGNQRAQDASISATGTLANTGTFYAGTDLDATGGWNGFIDEVKVYRDQTARTAAQVLADYNARSNPEGVSSQQGNNITNMPSALSNGLIGYWKTDESSSTAADSSGNGLTLTNNNTVAYAAGKFGNAASFTAASSMYLSTATTINGVKTVSFWTNNASTTDDYINLTSGAYINSSSGTVSATGFTSPTIYVNGVINGTLTASVWNHVVVTSDTAISANQFEIGRANASYNNGLIDDVRTYNRALSNSEVSQLYNWAPGPVGYWKMDEKTGNTAFDFSSNANDLTWTNSPTATNGKYGTAINLAGSDQQLTRADDADFDFADDADMSFETWFKHGTATVQEIIMSKFNEAGYKMIMESDGDITCGLDYDSTWTPTDSATSTAATYDDNAWHHVACVKSGASSLSLYIDGVLIATDSSITATNTLTNSDPLYVGIDADGTSNDFVGQIDEVKIYNYARSSGQIIEDMNAGHPAPGSPVGSAVAYWKIDEGYGTTANDSNSNTGGAENLTMSAATVWTNSGKFGKALNGATNVRASITDDPDLDFAAAEDLSISFWFKSDSATNPGAGINEYLVEKGGIVGTAAVGYAVYTSATTGLICFGIDDDAVTAFPEDETCSSSDIYDNTWHHILAKKTGTTSLDLYVDGKPNGTPDTTISATGTLANDATFYIGDANGTDGTDEFLGDMDEIKIFRSALTNSQVQVEYNFASSESLGALSNKSGEQVNSAAQEYCVPGDSSTCTAPVGRWDFEEKTGQDVYDSSGGGNNGTLGANNSVASDDPTISTGKVGASHVYSAGTFSRIPYSASSGLNITTDFTIATWIKRSVTDNAYSAIFAKTDNTNINYEIGICPESGCTGGAGEDNKLNFYADGGTDIHSTGTITDTNWHHIAFTRSGSTFNFYIDGKLDRSTTLSHTFNNSAFDYYIGTDNTGTAANSHDGNIDNLRIYNYARTGAQIARDYNRGKPVGHWKMDECQGTTLNDSSGNNYTGTLTVGATGSEDTVGTCTTSSTAWFNGVTGKRNYSIDLDGTDDYIEVSDTANLRFDAATEDFSLFTWVKRGANGEMNVISKEDADNDGYRLQFTSGNVVRCSVDTVDIDSTLTITDTNWHLIGCTIDRDGNGQVYLDGLANGTATAISSEVMATTANLRLGTRAYTAASYLDGQIDDAGVYNYPLTPLQVQLLYNEGSVRFGPNTGAP